MQKSQFTDEQIVAILQQAEKGEKPISEVCRQNNVSENTFYRWRSRFGGMNPNEAARVRELEKENARLNVSWLSETWRSTSLRSSSKKSERGHRPEPGAASVHRPRHKARIVPKASLPPGGHGPLQRSLPGLSA